MGKSKRPWVKKLLLIILVLAVAGAAVYWYVATEQFADTKDRKSVFTVNALDFIKEFEKDDKAANARYANKIITVNGRVAEMEPADTTVNIKFIDTTSGSYVIFNFQEKHSGEAKTLNVGDSASIKGSCSGSIMSEILGTHSISFKRCALNK
jgi:hypothetical protein